MKGNASEVLVRGGVVGSEEVRVGRVVERARVLEEEAISVEGIEESHGAIDGTISQAIPGRGVVVEFALDAGVRGAKGDDCDFGCVDEQLD